MKQETRQWLTACVAYVCWAIAGLIAWLRVIEAIEQRWTVLVVVFMGVAIAAGVKLSRMRLAATMTEVFRAGILAAEQRQLERDEHRA